MLIRLGNCLRQERINNELRQDTLADMIGVSTPTYRRMEQGNAGVPVGYWIRAFHLLGKEDTVFDALDSICLSQVIKRDKNVNRLRVKKTR
jgi:transcriptional regulator with XRE-family HTH domain